MEDRGTVLIADDDAGMRELLRVWFEAEGFAVQPAGDGRQLYDLLRDESIDVDVVITDISMPGMDGLSAVSLAGRAVPFIAITSFGDASTHARARTCGARAVLDKPFDPDHLVDLVRDLVAAES